MKEDINESDNKIQDADAASSDGLEPDWSSGNVKRALTGYESIRSDISNLSDLYSGGKNSSGF